MAAEDMRKEKRKRISSESPSSLSPASFSSLPHDVVLNCLARISRTQYPVLSLVSKTFRSILASADLDATRSVIAKPEKCLYVWLNLNNKPGWFVLSPVPNQRRLIPIPRFPYEHPRSSSVVSIGSEIYIMGGSVVKGKRSRRVFVLDCKSHEWRRLPKMRVARKEAAVDVIDGGKVRVLGGCSSRYDNDNHGEVYDPKTQTWEALPITELDPTVEGSSIPGYMVIGGKVYMNSMKIGLCDNMFVEEAEQNECCKAKVCDGKLLCDGLDLAGLAGQSLHHLVSFANPGGGRSATIWWKRTVESRRETEIWCAEVLFEIPPTGGLFEGSIEWSENVFTLRGCESHSDFFFHSALVTHDY